MPTDAKPKANRILIPCRDSKCSLRALRTAIEIGRETGAIVEMLNVYRVSTWAAASTTDTDSLYAAFKERAEAECSSLRSKVDFKGVDLTTACIHEADNEAVRVIIARRERFDADLIVIGARGRTGAAGVLLGTVTEQLIKKSPVPVLAVKKKGECLSVVKALQEIWT